LLDLSDLKPATRTHHLIQVFRLKDPLTVGRHALTLEERLRALDEGKDIAKAAGLT